MRTFIAVLVAASVSGLAAPALAHPGVAPAAGAMAGFLHPFGGIDHILTMIGVGALAALVGGRAVWTVPLAFLVVMTLGAAGGMLGLGLPLVELAIALSVVGIGVAMACGRSMPESAAVAVAALFAVFHGHAHGNEIGASLSAIEYAGGFVLATGLLHAGGLLGARLLARRFADSGTATVRLAGIGVAAIGTGLVGSLA